MEVINKVVPNSEQMEGFTKPGPEGPIYMVNLLKFKEKAVYEDGRQTELSGQEAYALYAEGVSKLLEDVGGKIEFNGQVERLMLGEVEELWDSVAIAMFPSRAAMLELMTTNGLRENSALSAAGLEGQLNIETTLNQFKTE